MAYIVKHPNPGIYPPEHITPHFIQRLLSHCSLLHRVSCRKQCCHCVPIRREVAPVVFVVSCHQHPLGPTAAGMAVLIPEDLIDERLHSGCICSRESPDEEFRHPVSVCVRIPCIRRVQPIRGSHHQHRHQVPSESHIFFVVVVAAPCKQHVFRRGCPVLFCIGQKRLDRIGVIAAKVELIHDLPAQPGHRL